ncbi:MULTISPECIES: ArsR/SmtB family transcription factor [Pacificibacter]|uniref:ArsR/SmtB family transcription factor n=1 Tax=Pacificibacter TaxID=1042323 RepID=UPI001C099838|nr:MULTISPECIES: metalloregulator ArsR/SmtB family transcription factor [Pacificibacter]MBU2935328.1 metalloregulator ArsR/SmtB family transcription factor [Pacificibacter marinus]MDO6615482.1 metalloregulator ArsR/SmtB family transcription factor [Pacificibacter sp. 1_MG-2023]
MTSSLPVFSDDLSDAELDKMMSSACDASNLLKALSHEGRLMILCHLVTGEKSVTELEDLLSVRQAAVSQQLARLRLEGLVTPRRDGKAIYYSLTDDRPKRILEVIYDLFCSVDDGAEKRGD